MPTAPRLALLRRLAVAGSFGLFALAVLQAQHGCGEESANAPATAPHAPIGPVPAQAPPADAPADATASAPAPVAPAATPEAEAEPAGHADAGSPTKAAAAEEEIPLFLGASKSGRVMQPPRARDREAAQQTQAPNPPPQQNARPGS